MLRPLVLVAAVALAAPAHAQTYQTDPGHTEVRFGWSHAGVSRQHGEFDKVAGTLVLDPENPEASSLEVAIDVASVSTGVPALDDHLRGADYLDADNHPEITFVSTAIERTGDATADITGDLTINGVTQPAVLSARMLHQGPHPLGGAIDYYQGEWLGFTATGVIDHMAFGVGSFSTGPISIAIDTELKAVE